MLLAALALVAPGVVIAQQNMTEEQVAEKLAQLEKEGDDLVKSAVNRGADALTSSYTKVVNMTGAPAWFTWKGFTSTGFRRDGYYHLKPMKKKLLGLGKDEVDEYAVFHSGSTLKFRTYVCENGKVKEVEESYKQKGSGTIIVSLDANNKLKFTETAK